MTKLYLLRHAKAGWAEPGMRDFDRPLAGSGRSDAEATGAAMRAAGYTPDRVLCSSARRARETLDALYRHAAIDRRSVVFLDRLYTDDAHGYLSILNEEGGDAGSALLIGHNPMMEDLATAVAGGGDDHALSILNGGFPTCGLAVIRFPEPLSAAKPGAGYLEAFFSPADL